MACVAQIVKHFVHATRGGQSFWAFRAGQTVLADRGTREKCRLDAGDGVGLLSRGSLA